MQRVAGSDHVAGSAVVGSAGILSQTPTLFLFGRMSAGYHARRPVRSAGMFSTTTGSQVVGALTAIAHSWGGGRHCRPPRVATGETPGIAGGLTAPNATESGG